MGVTAVISQVKLSIRLLDYGFRRNDDYFFRGSLNQCHSERSEESKEPLNKSPPP